MTRRSTRVAVALLLTFSTALLAGCSADDLELTEATSQPAAVVLG